MKTSLIKRNFLVFGLGLLALIWLVPPVFAAPSADAFVPTVTRTPTPTITLTPAPPTALPPATNTPTVAPTAANAQPTTEAQATQNQVVNNVPEETDSNAAAAGSSVLGFFLCVGMLLVIGLAALNIWARRRP